MEKKIAALKPIKVTVVGDRYSEKTWILNYYVTKDNSQDYKPTVFDNYSEIKEMDGNYYHLHLWDTAGQEDYKHLRPLSYPHTTCFLLLFAIDNFSSLDTILSEWLPEVRYYMPKTPCILVGTKGEKRYNNVSDSCEVVSLESITRAIKASKVADYIECSVKNGTGVDEMIEAAIRCSYRKKPHLYKRKITEMSELLHKMKDWIVLRVRERAMSISKPEQKKKKLLKIEDTYYM